MFCPKELEWAARLMLGGAFPPPVEVHTPTQMLCSPCESQNERLLLTTTGRPICLFDLYPTKQEGKSKLIQNETALINTEVRPFSSAPNL